MINKKLLGILAIVLVFGTMLVGCDNAPMYYDATGVWDFPIGGDTVTVKVASNTWYFISPDPFLNDTGTFTQSGNEATLVSNSWRGANIGSATLTSSTTISLTLQAPALVVGTFYGTKR